MHLSPPASPLVTCASWPMRLARLSKRALQGSQPPHQDTWCQLDLQLPAVTAFRQLLQVIEQALGARGTREVHPGRQTVRAQRIGAGL